MSISTEEIISTYENSTKLLHLSKMPASDKDKHLISSHPQIPLIGYNLGGRCDGLWVAYGSKWISMTHRFNNPLFPACCYIYEVCLVDSDVNAPNILTIKNRADIDKLIEDFPSYFINYDYYDFNFVDYLTDTRMVWSALRKDTFQKIPVTDRMTAYYASGRIFADVESARNGSEFYKQAADVERYRIIDWDAVSKKYHGAIFANWDRADTSLMYYIWYQALDVASGCIWNTRAIKELKLLYNKIDPTMWKKQI